MDKIPVPALLRLAELQAPATPFFRVTDADRRLVEKYERFKRTGRWCEWWER